MNCIDLKNPAVKAEMQRLLSIVPSTSLVNKLLMSSLDTSKITDKNSFREAIKSIPSSTEGIKVSKSDKPLGNFTNEQVEEVVDNLIFLASIDIDSADGSLRDISKISFSDIEDRLKAKASGYSDPVIQANYNEVLKPKNLERLVEMATAKLALFKITPDAEEDPNVKNKGDKEWEDSMLVANSLKAKAYVKLLVGSLKSQEQGNVLGMNKFVPFESTFKYLESILADLHTNVGESSFDKMMDILREKSEYKPELRELVRHLEKSTDQQKVQFYRAFSTQKLNYSSSILNEDTMGYKTDYIDSDSFSPEKVLVGIWDNSYFNKFLNLNKRVPSVKSKESIERRIQSFNKYGTYLNSREKESPLNKEDIDVFSVLLREIGINVDRRSIVKYINTQQGSNATARLQNARRNLLGKIYGNPTKTSVNTLPQLLSGINIEDGIIKGSITNEKEFLALAKIEQEYKTDITQNAFPGPDGKLYQTISQFDYTAKTLLDIRNRGNYYNKLINAPYSTSSIILNNENVLDKLKLQLFNSRRLVGADTGVTGKDISSVDEEAENIDRVVSKRLLPGLTLADKNRIYYLEGVLGDRKITAGIPTKEMIDTLMGYLADELVGMRNAYKLVTDSNNRNIPLIKGYHYAKTREDRLGNAFTLSLFPSLNPGTELAKELNLYDSNGEPYPITGAHPDAQGTYSEGFYNNSSLRKYIKDSLISRKNDTAISMLSNLFTFDENGSLIHTSLSTDLLNIILTSTGVSNSSKLTVDLVQRGLEEIALDYSYNTIVGAVEWTKLFTGDPRFYKSLDDFTKRTPATSATGDHLLVDSKIGVKENFTVAIAPNIEESDIVLLNEGYRDNIARWLGIDKKDRRIKEVLDPYNNVNRTDAQGWMTFDRFREVLIGLGEWNKESMDPAFERMKKGTETQEDIKLFTNKTTTMQPRKGMHFERVNINGSLAPVYLKYSTAVLFPGMIKSSPKLARIAAAMKAQEVDELVVGDGIKVLTLPASTINENEISFNKLTLSNRYWKLQQDLPYKEKETNVGSQIQKNILSDISLGTDFYNGRTGEDVIKDIHAVTGELSNRGLNNVLDRLGIEQGKVNYNNLTQEWEIDETANLNGLYDYLLDTYINKGESGDIINALRSRQPLDFLISNYDSIMSEITSLFTNMSIKLEQPGGSAIQMSNYGFDFEDNRETARTISELPQNIKNEIVWLQKDNELKPPRVELDKDGNPVFKPGQVAITYNELIKRFGDTWGNIKDLPLDKLLEKIDPKALEIIGYRIPNQKLASNDLLQIVAILPPTAGNTIIAYKSITTKTGSDFDIDKMYYIMRPFYKNPQGKIKTVQYLDDSNSTVEERYDVYLRAEKDSLDDVMDPEKSLKEQFTVLVNNIEEFSKLPIPQQNTKKALQSKRVDLYSEVLSHPSSYLRLMASVDPVWLKNNIKMVQPIRELADLEFFSRDYQIEVRRQNSSSKAGVGQNANQLVDHAISQWANKRLVDLEQVLGTFDLSQHYTSQFENIEALDSSGNVIPADKYGSVTPSSFRVKSVDENYYHITEVLSAYMNAFVDAAKDNYIGKANFNSLTNNTAFLLLRSGVSPQKVNAFIQQPIIKRYVELKQAKEGQTTPISNEADLNKKLEDEFEGTVNEGVTLDDFDTTDLLTNIIKGNKATNQHDLLALFKQLQKLSKSLKESIDSTKSDTGIGTSLFDAYATINLKKKVENDGVVLGYKNIFEKDGNMTMAGTFHKNGPQAAMSFVGSKTLLNTKGIYQGLQIMYSTIWGTHASDSDRVRKLYNMTKAVLIHEELSKQSGVNISTTPSELSDLISGENNIAYRTINLQSDEKYSNNLLLSHLSARVGYKDTISAVGINNAKPRSAKINQWLTEAWLDLYEDPTQKQFAIDLAKYAFYSSAFQNGLGTLHKLIPFRIYNDLGINRDTFNTIHKDMNNTDGATLAARVLPYILKNSWDDSRLVPIISAKKRKKLPGTNATGLTFIVMPEEAGNIKVDYNNDGEPVYKPYVAAYISTSETTTDKQLFKLVHTTKVNGSLAGVYARVNKLGKTSGIYKLFEFPESKSANSILASNNVPSQHKDIVKSNLKSNDYLLPVTSMDNIIIANNLDNSETFSNIVPEENNEIKDALSKLDNGCKKKK